MQTTAPIDNRTATKAAVIVARSMFREMREQGFTDEQIIAVASELITQVHADLQRDPQAAE